MSLTIESTGCLVVRLSRQQQKNVRHIASSLVPHPLITFTPQEMVWWMKSILGPFLKMRNVPWKSQKDCIIVLEWNRRLCGQPAGQNRPEFEIKWVLSRMYKSSWWQKYSYPGWIKQYPLMSSEFLCCLLSKGWDIHVHTYMISQVKIKGRQWMYFWKEKIFLSVC